MTPRDLKSRAPMSLFPTLVSPPLCSPHKSSLEVHTVPTQAVSPLLPEASSVGGSELRMPPKSQKAKKKCLPTRKPHFFKVLLGDFAQRLRIPPKFLKHISSVGSKKAILQGPSGSKWHVELGKDMKDTFLTTGWPKFVKDHSLREYEFLVFQYDGDMRFTVLIFDTSACEREDAFAVRPRRKPRQFEGKRKRGRPPKHSPEVGCIIKSEAIEHGMSLELLKDDVQLPNLLQIQPFQQAESGLPYPAPACDVKVKREESELLINILRNTTKRSKGGRISTRRPLTEKERLRAEEAANSFTSAFPYIVMRMAPSQVYRPYMRIPKWFSREHLPPKRSNLVLRDPCGKSWIVTYIPSLRCQISRGWSVFARTNKLEEGDYCVLELIGPIELRVHIFRAVEVEVEAEETLQIAMTPTT